MYRINYGNGTVSNRFNTLKLAQSELLTDARRGDPYVLNFRIQHWVDGEWHFSLGAKGRLATATRTGLVVS